MCHFATFCLLIPSFASEIQASGILESGTVQRDFNRPACRRQGDRGGFPTSAPSAINGTSECAGYLCFYKKKM